MIGIDYFDKIKTEPKTYSKNMKISHKWLTKYLNIMKSFDQGSKFQRGWVSEEVKVEDNESSEHGKHILSQSFNY
jgi:hypothetical protein